MQQRVLVTGGSGFLGSFVVRDLLASGFDWIYVLMRGRDPEECTGRLRALWRERPELEAEIGKRIYAVCGDIERERLGLDDATYEELVRNVTHIVHAAAEIGVNQTARRFAEVNVDGTANVLLFAADAVRSGSFERLVHISTAYVAGEREGLIVEDELPETGFNSLYEQSKHGAEQLVRDAGGLVPAAIVRPAQIVGDSKTGFTATFNTLYYPLKLYLKGNLPVVPVAADQKLNMVPVDLVAGIVARALTDPQSEGKTYHAVIPPEHQPTVGEMLAFVRAWAQDELGFDPGEARCMPVPGAGALGRMRNLAASEAPKHKGALQNMLALAPYFSEHRTFDTSNAEELLGTDRLAWPDWRDYLPNLLAYATRRGFLNYTGRNVFEQMIVRLSSKRNTLTYYDVTREGMRKTDADEAKDAILKAAAGLVAHGVEPGDRVVLVGINSTRYFIADAAVGLVGAVSVPLYYTTPVPDIVSLTRKSGAVLAFIGTSRLLDDPPSELDIPLVALLDQAEPANEDQMAEGAIGASESQIGDRAPSESETNAPPLETWRDFLASGAQAELPAAAPLDAIATIRYTSGTTGEPKGVMFDQYQLRWMGEVMPSLLDWRTRNGKLRYLSFLPMSHVVEGILVAYAPYYILSDIEMYYLNDFDALTETLPKVRPTLFFSVPRFYEKVWDQFESSPVGARYLAMEEGPAKRALGAIARRGLLRKAGLDRCRQLIVGSAPVSMELLEAFRDLGIEIHNAYGVTEAPLVALSRLGANELGSVGALLPETQAVIDEDGEILVSGPQVTIGYDGVGAGTDENGRFATGDLGSLSKQGNLVIGGRKKELVVTSYGKNISPEKVETLLKGIPGVSEALLVGDGKPYVTALLWLEDEARGHFDADVLDAEILSRNKTLSHPEQVKRWAVMDGRLSIAAGELTPNLKLRRRHVAEANASTIEALYADDCNSAPNALHIGAQR